MSKKYCRRREIIPLQSGEQHPYLHCCTTTHHDMLYSYSICIYMHWRIIQQLIFAVVEFSDPSSLIKTWRERRYSQLRFSFAYNCMKIFSWAFYIYRGWYHSFRGCHVAPPCFYSSPEWTNHCLRCTRVLQQTVTNWRTQLAYRVFFFVAENSSLIWSKCSQQWETVFFFCH